MANQKAFIIPKTDDSKAWKLSFRISDYEHSGDAQRAMRDAQDDLKSGGLSGAKIYIDYNEEGGGSDDRDPTGYVVITGTGSKLKEVIREALKNTDF